MLKKNALAFLCLLMILLHTSCDSGTAPAEPDPQVAELEEVVHDAAADSAKPPVPDPLEMAISVAEEAMAPSESKIEMGKRIEDFDQVSQQILQLKQFKLHYRYETSLSLLDEGKHCDLTDWKHGYSPWKDISEKVNELGVFELPQASAEDRQTFPVMGISAIKSAYRKHCNGEHWLKKIENLKAADDYPSSIGISKALLLLEGQAEDGGKFRQVYHIELMMGC